MSKEDLYNKGMELFMEESFDAAIAAFQQALDEDAKYTDALHAHQEKLDDAIEIAKKLIEVAPDDELAHTSLSIFYQQKGMIAEAEHIAAQARTLGWKRQLSQKNEPQKS
jgi:tetratricopeptide (TPR) repeat protein